VSLGAQEAWRHARGRGWACGRNAWMAPSRSGPVGCGLRAAGSGEEREQASKSKRQELARARRVAPTGTS
jgi:hypothetical protein